MSRVFPAFISKTQWTKASVQQRQNMLQVCAAIAEVSLGGGVTGNPLSASATMAFARGLPERHKAKWLKTDIPQGARDDLVLLASRVRRMLKAEAREERKREAELKKRQAACAHEWEDIPGSYRRYCHVCTLTIGEN